LLWVFFAEVRVPDIVKRDDYQGGNNSGGGSGYRGQPPEETSQRFREDGGLSVGGLRRFGRCDQCL